MKDEKLIKTDLKDLVKKFSKINVVYTIQKNYSKENIKTFEVKDISLNRFLGKPFIDEKTNENLKNSIKENGVFTPFYLNKAGNTYEILTGRRRFEILKELNFTQVPVIILELSEEDELLLLLSDINDHKKVDNYELAFICKTLKEKYNYSNKTLSLILNESVYQISNLIRILSLPDEIVLSFKEGKISYGHLKIICTLKEPELSKTYREIINNNQSVRKTEKMVRKLKKGEGNQYVFEMNNEKHEIIIKFKNSEEMNEFIKKIS